MWFKSLVRDGSRVWDVVWFVVVVGLVCEIVDVGEDIGVVGLVGIGERDGLRRSEGV